MREITILIFVLTVCFLISLGAAMHYSSALVACEASRDEAATEAVAAIRTIRGSLSAEIINIKTVLQEQREIRREACAKWLALDGPIPSADLIRRAKAGGCNTGGDEHETI